MSFTLDSSASQAFRRAGTRSFANYVLFKNVLPIKRIEWMQMNVLVALRPSQRHVGLGAHEGSPSSPGMGFLPIVFHSPPNSPSPPHPFLSLGFLSTSSIVRPSRGKSPSVQTPTRKRAPRVEGSLRPAFPKPTVSSRCSRFTTQIAALKENLRWESSWEAQQVPNFI